ncbi:hypothetical protein BT63DRAFT_392337 [Microthyrium microscopicum]|uniref:NADP-dependent oxidoreductase domain-containing protein n=1 Tax=Microthyrium microscopicum TaxID=703497 RepID=A0A6A6TY50_9PEZI|nr:hypothetical protein BT63DRAFT_392337 [Microthyrium microscopicum]
MSKVTKPLPTRPLGRNGPEVPRLGLGLMSLSGNYGLPGSDETRLAYLDEVYKAGETFWDSADEHGDSGDLLNKWFKANPTKREDIFLSTKFGIRKVLGKAWQNNWRTPISSNSA